MAKLHELRFELLPHPPYSPDLTFEFPPCDFFYIPKPQDLARGKEIFVQ